MNWQELIVMGIVALAAGTLVQRACGLLGWSAGKRAESSSSCHDCGDCEH